MLTSLSIKNYALIEDIQLDLREGFTVITGETGAGKSIMLGALSLLLGKRADYSAIRNPHTKCVIEGTFNISVYNLEPFFEAKDLDYEVQTIIRREILPSRLGGKSRAFVNDTPTNLNALQALGTQLLDIHSQHETLSLGETEYQFHVIDVLAKNSELLSKYKDDLRELKGLQQGLETLKEEQSQAARDYDYNLFLLNELYESKLQEGMQETLEARYEELNNVEELTEELGAAITTMHQEEIGALGTIKELKNRIQRISGVSSSYEQLYERLQSVSIEMDDIATELEQALEKVEANPEELEQVNEKLQILYNLHKKHAVSTISELKEIEADLQQKVGVSENAEDEITKAEKAISDKKNGLMKLASQLHENRKKIIPRFEKEIESLLYDLGMPNAQLKIELQQQSEFIHNGSDRLIWKLSANKGGKFLEIKKAASGGELSRIMLAVKSILAGYSSLPTIVFDEIDTGISGEIAQKMAGILYKMGEKMQVLAISHLPQIAGKGDNHFKIFKEISEQETITKLKKLNNDERIAELALMLGGNKGGESALAHAKALLN